MNKYPGCTIYKDDKGHFQIGWYSGNPAWENGIEWIAAFRHKEDAVVFIEINGGPITDEELEGWAKL